MGRDAVKKVATIGVILLTMLVVIFFLFYQEYEYTYTREARVKSMTTVAETELNKTLYRSLKRETQCKTDRLAKEIRKDLLEGYEDDMESFVEDYDNPTEDSVLVQSIDKALKDRANRYFYIENRANDIFALSQKKDQDGERELKGITRVIEDEIELHYNQEIAEQSIENLLDGEDKDMFWRFKDITNGEDPSINSMDIEKVLRLPPSELKDFEFLTVSYIDKHGDITGMPDFSPTGMVKNSKKIMIVQGFSLHEQIEKKFKPSYVRLEKNEKLQLAIIKENRKDIAVKLFVVIAMIIISFVAMSIIQDIYVKGCGVDARDK